MLISVIGTQCVGKSTFISDFVNEYKDFITPEIDYRTLIQEKNLKFNREGNMYSQKTIFEFILEQTEKCSLQKDNNYILDRSIIDAYVYTYWLYKNVDTSTTNITQEHISDMYNILSKKVDLYDYFIYIPLTLNDHVAIVDDKFRDTNEEFRKDVDNIFSSTVKMLPISNKLIRIYGTRSDRIEQIKKVLK